MKFDGTYLHLSATEMGTAALANASSNTGVVAAVSGSGGITPGHLAVFGDAAGTIADGGPAGVAAAPTYLNHSNNNQVMSAGVYNADTTTAEGGGFNVLLPTTITLGQSWEFRDFAGTWAQNNFTVNPNGYTIMGQASSLVCNVSGLTFALVYNGTTLELQ
jgi:hypothetical protein